MRLDAADLATLEIDVENLEPLGRDVARMLLEHIHTLENDAKDLAAEHATALEEAKGEAESAVEAEETATKRVDEIVAKVKLASARMSRLKAEASLAIDDLIDAESL